METFELCKKLHELKPDWQTIGDYVIKFKGDDPRIYHDNVRRTCYDWAPEYTLEYLLDKLPDAIESKLGLGALTLSSRRGQYRDGWMVFYGDDEGCSVDASLVFAAETPLDGALKLAIIMAEKGLVQNMMSKDVYEEDSVLLIVGLIILVCIIFIAVNAERNSPRLSRNEICQKHFGKDYVYQNGGRSADFCVGDSGIPKYPKTWIEKR